MNALTWFTHPNIHGLCHGPLLKKMSTIFEELLCDKTYQKDQQRDIYTLCTYTYYMCVYNTYTWHTVGLLYMYV